MAVKKKPAKAKSTIYVEDFSALSHPPLTMRQGERVSAKLRTEIAQRFGAGYAAPGRSRIAQRYDILRDHLKPHVKERLMTQYESEVVRRGTETQITSALNPGSDIVERVCQVYRHGVRRSVVGVSKKKQKAMARLYREAHANAIGRDWNRYGYFLGPTPVIPRVRSRRMSFDTILPHRMEPVLDEQNPSGPPLAIAYRTTGSQIVIQDAYGSTTYDLRGATLTPVGDAYKSTAHSEDALPYSVLRFETPLDPSDWMCSYKHQRIVDGTLDVAVIAAVMGFVRKTQNKKLLTLSGYLDGLIKGQNLGDPEKPVVLPTAAGQTNTITLSALDFNQDPASFLAHIRFWYGALADSTGVPAVIHTESAAIDLEFAFDGLNELREDQISYVEEFECDLAVAMVIAANDGNHPAATDLPTVEEVREGFRVQFGEMSRKMADPLAEQQSIDWKIRHGLENVLDLVLSENPNLDVEGARKVLQENLDTNGEFWDQIAARNGAGVDAEGNVQTAAQANGAQGPKVRDGKQEEKAPSPSVRPKPGASRSAAGGRHSARGQARSGSRKAHRSGAARKSGRDQAKAA